MIPEFHYRLDWRSPSARPGHHRSNQFGGGHEFCGHAPLVNNPDPRNLDVRATLHDPFGQLMVRIYRQRSTVPVYVVADLSASLGFRGVADKMALLSAFSASAAYSAYRTGDPFGFIACDETVRSDLTLPLRWHKAAAPDLSQRLGAFVPRGKSADGLHRAALHLGKQRALVFLVSDFHFPLERAADLLGSLIRHDVVPVVLWDSAEYQRLPHWGLVDVEDPETGEKRRLLMRPGLRKKFLSAFTQRREDLIRLCSRYGREPFFLVDRYVADDLTEYFLRG
ncbi:DUF58 domain-containing protein [Methylogaea oryzae]|uniref:DUF58 domain-containing protein n=2 Tax=Methylogaea oryzae TaxID=1295382 RepID=A0A8D4VR15_9GAMM|nr:DUF58 domain-containing protein [Methylogaea oryzae]BBL72468.1 DUF58 domain-containing protein [Methylogaea oryzae]